MSTPVVSVVIPTYNRSPLLPRAVQSVVAQSFTDWEIVLVDDGSTDDTPRLAQQYAGKLGDRWRYVRQQHRGGSAARNRGIDASRGQFIAFLDSDDEFAPNKLARQLELLEHWPDLGFVYSDFSFVDFDGVRHASAFDEKFPIARSVTRVVVAPALCECTGLFDILLRGYFIATIVGLVRRSVLGCGIRFDERLSYAEEWLFFLRVARQTRAGYVDEPLSLHHYTAGSLARTDKQANVERYGDVLRAILRQFPDLSAAQRATVRANLSDASRQLGYRAAKEVRRGDAVRWFFEATCQRPTLTTVRELTRAILSLLRPRGNGPRALPHSTLDLAR